METRRRSRSKTPFLRSSCDHENCEFTGEESHVHHHHKKKQSPVVPSVNTIVEEVVEVTSSSASSTPSLSLTKASEKKTKTSDYSSEETSSEKTMKKLAKQSTSTKTTHSTATVITTSRNSLLSAIAGTTAASASVPATSTPKGDYLQESFASQFGSFKADNKQQADKESRQNRLNLEFERSQRETEFRGKNKAFARSNLTQSFNTAGSDQSSNGDLSDHLAYMEYKNAGEYWRKTPKTDYTYSELSPHRRLLAPGIVAMPNMSRPSLENHHDRINYLVDRNPANETYIRQRYESSKYSQNRKAVDRLVYDSGDETDYTLLKNYRNRNSQESWFMRIITSIVTICSTVWNTVTGRNSSANAYSYRSSLHRNNYYQEKRGFFGTIRHWIVSSFQTVFRTIYRLGASLLWLDIWALQSPHDDNRRRRRFFIGLAILLPFILLGCLYVYLYPNEPFPPKSFSDINFDIPSLPRIDLAEFVNQEKFESIKSQTLNRLNDARVWTDDYLSYLRTISKNIYDEGRKLFQRQEYFERA